MTLPGQQPVPRQLVMTQAILGACAQVLFNWPYVRGVRGMEHLRPEEKYLFVANHVSLLDTILLGGLFWRRGCYPILVLGDKAVWHASWIKRTLSSRIGFLVERGKLNPRRIDELQTFGRSSQRFNLVVYPEGTRGDGVHVAPCQPGLYYIAQEARVPIVPVYMENMQLVSTKRGGFHPIRGLRKVDVHFGEPIAPATYLPLPREEFTEFVRQNIATLRPTQSAAHLNLVPPLA